MANSIAKLAILLTTDTKGLQAGFAQAKGMTSAFASSMNGAGGVGGLGGGLTGLMGLSKAGVWAAAAAGLGAMAVWATKVAEQSREAEINFRVMMGSARDSQRLMAGIKQFSLASPFDQAQLQGSAQTLLAFGMTGDKIIPTLKTLGDISLGNAEKLERLTLAFAQTQAAGKLMGQDLLQMINAGFNPLQEISRLTGRSMSDLRKQMESGAISAQMVALAFKSATEAGGRFNGAMQASQGTIRGQWNMLKENITGAVRPIGTELALITTEVLRGANLWANFFKEGTFALKAVGNEAEGAGAKLQKLMETVERAEVVFKGWTTEGFEGSINRFNDLQKKLGEDGASFAKRFQTPDEQFRASAYEAERLYQAGAISAEILKRATEAAAKAWEDSAKSAEQIKNATTPGTAATSRFSMQGRSESLAFQRNFSAQERANKEAFDQREKMRSELEKMRRAVERQEPVTIEEHPL